MRFVLVAVVVLAGAAAGMTWVETTHPDFVDGNVDAQMYVSHRSRLEPDSGCVEFFSRFDVDNNGFYDLACSDDSGPFLTLYLGSDSGYFPANKLQYDIAAGGNVDLADLNLDGWAELIHSGWRMGQTTIYWGAPGGPSSTDTTVLRYTGQGEDVNVYDLDRDGYLDIIVGSDDGNLYIFWGSSSGYSSANRRTISLGYMIGHNTEIADFDKDGWGDIAVTMWTYNECPIIYWGPNRQPRETVWLPFRWNNAHGITVGDFNRDEWLDIVYTGYDTVLSSVIYFGSDSGFHTNDFTSILPGKCYGGSAAADWNGDGWLDLVFMRGNWTQGGRWKPSVYLNTGAPPYFSDASSTELGTDTLNASGGFIADLNFDGSIDIFVNNMLPNSPSYVMWGPTYMVQTALPADNDHHGVFREPGGSYDRAKTAQYYSSVFDVGQDSTVLGGTASWISFEPPGSRVAIAYRSGNTPEPDPSWTSFATVATNGGNLPGQILGRRYIQYRARFSYDRPCYLPDLEEISTVISVTLPQFRDVGVTQVVAPNGNVDSGTVVVPAAVVRNHGDQPAMFGVQFRVGAQYAESTVVSLAPGTEDTARFASWTAQPVGGSMAVAYTVWEPDEAHENDTARAIVNVVPPPVVDVGPVAILAPVGRFDSGTVSRPRVVVRNFGDQAASFPVFLSIGAAYADSTVATVAAGAEETLAFVDWTASPLGTLPVVCYTNLAADQNRANDTLRGIVDVDPPPYFDVGPVLILAPVGQLDSGVVIEPQVVVRNFGDQPASFPVFLTIGALYSDSVGVSVAAGAEETLAFADWAVLPVGTLPVVCYTNLPVDQNRANDTLRDSVVVDRLPYFDVGPTAILVPTGIIDSGTAVVPEVVVRNFGNQVVAFPLTLVIDTAYTETVTDSLAPGEADTVAFPTWTARDVGLMPMGTWTSLAQDQRHSNDTLLSQFRVARVSAFDVGPTAILAPTGSVDSGSTVTPRAVVRNFGNQPAIFPVRLLIDTGYSYTVLDTLDPGASDTVDFAAWTATVPGSHGVTCLTALAQDQDRSNDTARAQVIVFRLPNYDVGPTAVLAPLGNVDSGTAVVPRIVARNFGDQIAVFPVTLKIGTGHSATTDDTLEPGASDTVEFPEWTAAALGLQTMVCYTALPVDQDRTNDTIRSQVTVVQRPERDVGPTAILAPVGIVDSGTPHTPTAVVRNFGNQLAIFEVTMAIDTGYRQSLWDTLDPGASDTVRFAQWAAPPSGAMPVVCNTRMMFDERPENDTIRDSVRVRPPAVHDVGVAMIVAPLAEQANGDTIKPRAVVCNFGNVAESFFDVRCRIGSAYDQNANVVTAIQPGATAEVTFPNWIALSGDHVVSCSTQLITDANAANDKVTQTLHVAPAAELVIDPDITDRMLVGARTTYAFHALLESERFDAVNLTTSAAPAGWASWLVDSTGDRPITGLDVVLPGHETGFRLHVEAPSGDLPGVVESLPAAVFVVRGALASDPTVRDSAVLTLTLLPNLEVHNFPNPVKDRTTFVIGLPAAGKVSLTVYNRAGERVRRLLDRVELEPNIHFFDWDAANDQGRRVARGNYQYVFEYVRADKTERIIHKLVVARE